MRTGLLSVFIAILPVCGIAAAADDEIPATALANFERFDPLEMSGVFSYFTHRFPGMDIPVHVCLFDHWASGSSFLGCTVSNDVPRAVGCAIQDCFWWEWYRLGRTNGETNLAVVAMLVGVDGSDNAGYDNERFVVVFENENGSIQKRPSCLVNLISSPSFSWMEHPLWFVARRSNVGVWHSEADSEEVLLFESPVAVSPPNQNQLAALTAFLHDRTNAPPVAASNVVFEADSGRDPFFALVSDGTDTTEDGCLWIPFLWNGTEWTDAPTNGFACASGRCPASFRAATNEFYRLTLSGEPSRLVVLKTRGGTLHEPLWEEALGNNASLLDFDKGVPERDLMGFLGIGGIPHSVFQSLCDGMLFPFLRLERIVPESLAP